MAATVRITRDGHLDLITPDPASGAATGPSGLDGDPGVDVAVLEVAGGHLTWSVLAPAAPPVAVLDDADLAQEWVWAVYGERVALALADGGGVVDGTEPALPALAASARRLAYAHWAARWWPASVIDSIPPLDEHLLDREIAELTEACDPLFAGRDDPADTAFAVDIDAVDIEHPLPRPGDYALTAGPEASEVPADGLTLARGTGGSDWRRCPPGLVDASERAVSWEVVRAAARTTVMVQVVAAPGPPLADRRLTPRAAVSGVADPLDIGLRRVADAWLGDARVSGVDSVPGTGTGTGTGMAVDVYLPGFGPPVRPRPGDRLTRDRLATDRLTRERIRDLARARLAGARNGSTAGHGAPLLAEIAAASDDSDF
ncbi:hypothetical protein ACIQVO_23440 [Streptomyces sp. NPDC101062]|uniref:hypothetical protein n=1 Tax=unclassified Streptomyces TaxID=2593676 RepID=UPI00382EBAF6